MAPSSPDARVFLFMQGTSSPIFWKIADQLAGKGHRCLRINLNVGDQIFWRRKGGFQYRGKPGHDWHRYVAAFLERHGVTDLILLGEERPYHRSAVDIARSRGIAIFIVEMGYLRPDWLTIERDGMSSNSHFPADPADIVNAARALPEPDFIRRYAQTFAAEAAYDLLYNLSNVFLWFLFPHYQRHAVYHPLVEYYGWVRQLIVAGKRRRAAKAIVDDLTSGAEPFFLFPLQLQTDFQLRAHSSYNDQREAIAEILTSFAAQAPLEAQLAVKVHPLDNGLIDWKAFIDELAARLGVAKRIKFLAGGDLNALLLKAQGTVTINSTVGLQALQLAKPVKVLGEAVFNVSGLSDQAPLDDFWRAPQPPTEPLRSSFFRLLAAALQVRGNFYSWAGSDAGAAAIAERLHEGTVNEPGGYVDPPPRKRPVKIASKPGG